MSRQKIKILITALLSVVILCELGYIIKKFAGSSAMPEASGGSSVVAKVMLAPKACKINMQTIPAYTVEGSDKTYFVDSDLELFGFKCTLNKDRYELTNPEKKYSMTSDAFMPGVEGANAAKIKETVLVRDQELECFRTTDNVLLIPSEVLGVFGLEQVRDEVNTVYYALGDDAAVKNMLNSINNEVAMITGSAAETEAAATEAPTDSVSGGVIAMDGSGSTGTASSRAGAKIIVLDPGHGKSSGSMSSEEKRASGWVQNSSGAWGEWRHYKIGSSTVDCEGDGCNHRVTPKGACWYPIGNGDRSSEPPINLNNALAAKKYLEQMGYIVRMARSSNDENPSITRRCSYCYPNNDTSQTADATCMVVIHSNAGGGRGTSYIALEGEYDQRGIPSTYVEDSNRLGKICNDAIANNTSLSNSGAITFEPQLISFMKSPVPCAYLEIGFFDSSSDLSILESEYDEIGKAIAEGVDEYCKSLG